MGLFLKNGNLKTKSAWHFKAKRVSQFVGWKPGTESVGLFSKIGNLKTKSAGHFKAKHINQFVGWKPGTESETLFEDWKLGNKDSRAF